MSDGRADLRSPRTGTPQSPDTGWQHVTEQGHLAARKLEQRQRRRRNLITLAVIAALAVAAVLGALHLASRLGVPGFSYTNEYGSRCTNGFIGHDCDPITVAELNLHAETDFPEDVELLESSFENGQDWRVRALLRVPAAEVEQTTAMLDERFGECEELDPDTALQDIPAGDYTEICRDRSSGMFDDEGERVESFHEVVRAVVADGSMIVDVEVFTV
ncbi:hypothetical protein ACF3NT_03650 [Naumannella halotolerans]|nr:hypothetical protein [Naumannella halotolerans]